MTVAIRQRHVGSTVADSGGQRTGASRRAVAWAGIALSSALLATACTGGSNPTDNMPITTPTTTGTGTGSGTSGSSSTTTTPSTTSSAPSTTTTPGVPPPVANIPPAARPNTKAGAQEFVRYFIAQVERAYVTPNPRLLDGLWDPECGWCKDIHATIAAYKANGERYEGQPFILEATGVIAQQQGFTVILATGRTPKGRVVNDKGVSTQEIPAESINVEFTLWRHPEWQVTRVTVSEPK